MGVTRDPAPAPSRPSPARRRAIDKPGGRS